MSGGGSMYEDQYGAWMLRVCAGRDALTGKKTWKARSFRGSKREAERALAAFVTELSTPRPKGPSRTFGELGETLVRGAFGRLVAVDCAADAVDLDGQLRGLADRKGRPDRRGPRPVLRRPSRAGRAGWPTARRLDGGSHPRRRPAGAGAGGGVGWRADNPAERANPGRYDTAEIRPPSADEVRRLFDAALQKDHELLTFVALEAETGARRSELAALRYSDFAEGCVSISRSLVIGLDSEENQRRYAGHSWRTGVSRGPKATAIIEKPKPKNPSIGPDHRHFGAGALLVADLRAQHVARAAACGVTLPQDSFVFAAEVDGSRPIRPETWTHRFTRLRTEVGLATVRLHDLRHFIATTLLASGTDLATVAGRLGHGSGGKTTLAIYGHLLRGAPPDRAAADLLASVVRPVEPPTVED